MVKHWNCCQLVPTFKVYITLYIYFYFHCLILNSILDPDDSCNFFPWHLPLCKIIKFPSLCSRLQDFSWNQRFCSWVYWHKMHLHFAVPEAECDIFLMDSLIAANYVRFSKHLLAASWSLRSFQFGNVNALLPVFSCPWPRFWNLKTVGLYHTSRRKNGCHLFSECHQ